MFPRFNSINPRLKFRNPKTRTKWVSKAQLGYRLRGFELNVHVRVVSATERANAGCVRRVVTTRRADHAR